MSNRPGRWWADHRVIARHVNGVWVPAPMRLERVWAWLLHRGPPRPPLPRIVWIVWILFVAASWVFGSRGPRLRRWLYWHPIAYYELQGALWTLAGLCGVAFAVTFIALTVHWRRQKMLRRADRALAADDDLDGA